MAISSIKAIGDITKLFPDGSLELSDIVILKRISRHCQTNDFGHDCKTTQEWKSWNPTNEDIPSLIESIRFWESLFPKRHKNKWGPIDFQIYSECQKKSIICQTLLSRTPKIQETMFYNSLNQ